MINFKFRRLTKSSSFLQYGWLKVSVKLNLNVIANREADEKRMLVPTCAGVCSHKMYAAANQDRVWQDRSASEGLLTHVDQ